MNQPTHRFVPRLSDGTRAEITLSDGDYRKVERGRAWEATVTDVRTGTRYRVAGAECAIPDCFCDAVVLDVEV